MIEKPVMFSAPMVLAVLEGRKTQTRRLAKARSRNSLLRGQPDDPQEKRHGHFGEPWTDSYILDPGNADWIMKDAAHRPGEAMWVRENFRMDAVLDGKKPSEAPEPCRVWYEAGPAGNWAALGFGKLHPSIHMPRHCSRIDLTCTATRVERLHAITEEDAIAEGLSYIPPSTGLNLVPKGTRWGFDGLPPEEWQEDGPEAAYQRLWAHLHGQASWDANPLVWVYSFEVTRAPVV